MKAAGDAFAKRMAEAMKQISVQLLQVQTQLQADNNNILFSSLSAIQNAIDDLKGRMGV
jgi:hypothetical protein